MTKFDPIKSYIKSCLDLELGILGIFGLSNL